MYTIIKRIIDLVISIIALPFLVIAILFIGIAIKLDDGGPIFYLDKRIGKNFKVYRMYKFRSMKVNAPNIINADGSTYNSKNDSRVTRVGKIIRKTSIDELPQFLNVLFGQMSLIGPRPRDLGALGTFKEDEEALAKVLPGITGYSQAYYRNSIGVRDKRLKDAWYANNVSFWLDLKIFFKTIITVLKRDNIYTEDGNNKKGYLLLANGNKESNDKYESKEIVRISSMRKPCFDAISSFDYNLYMGINRKYAPLLETDYNKKITMYDDHIYRSIFNVKDNYRAYKNLNTFLKNNKIDVIHCNTPIGGLIGRICGYKNGVNKIIYTVHGFHFYRGNNFIKNLIFKSVEKRLAKKTDAIITMNKEDYEAALKFKLKENGKVYFTHGVGINIDDYNKVKVDYSKKRKELGLDKNDIVLISVGDINENKNISLLLDIIANIDNPSIKCIICGDGLLKEKMINKSKDLNISNRVFFLGYRNDIKELLKISNIYISTSKREGLPRSLMEAMASCIPCVVSNIRGNRDLIDTEAGGFCCNNIDEYIYSINNIINNKKNVQKFIDYNMNKIYEYSINNVVEEIKNIYEDLNLGE